MPVAPTPHPLVELLGLVLSPLGPRAVEDVTVALGFVALSACGWVIYRLGAQWFGWAAGALAALIFITRAEVLSYGVRAYVDIPYLTLVLGALLVGAGDQQPAKRFEDLHRAREADLPWGQAFLPGRLGCRLAHQIVAEQVRPQRLARHGRRLAVDHLQAERLFDGADIQFRMPSLVVEIGDVGAGVRAVA